MTEQVDKALNALTEQRKAEIMQQMALQLHEKCALKLIGKRLAKCVLSSASPTRL